MGKYRFIKGLFISALCGVSVMSCDRLGSTAGKEDAVARVNETYLSMDELHENVPFYTGTQDSLAVITRYIDKWATKKLLTEAAEFNLSEEKKEDIDRLVAQFRSDLLVKDYYEKLVQKKIDTVVQEKDLQSYYEKYSSSFLVENMLVKVSYVNVLKDNSNYNAIKKFFKSLKNEDRSKLEELSLHLKSYALNDSVWVDIKQVYDKLPFIDAKNRDTYLKNNTFFEVEEENSTYFVKVNAVLTKGDKIPFSYLKESLKKMVINDRKIQLVKQYEEDILKDAKKNNKYEVF